MSVNSVYNASSNQDLVSPPIDLSGVQAPIQLRWAMKYQLDNASSDHGWVEIREVGGANAWRIWEFLDASMTTTVGSSNLVLQESAGWGTHYADISGYAGKRVEVVFHLDSDASVQLAGLAIDDVSVLGCPRSSTGEGGGAGGGSTTGEGGATGSGAGGAGTGGATAANGAVASGGSTTGEGGATVSGAGGAGPGPATAGSGTGAGANGDPSASSDTTGGCGCRFVGGDEPPWPWPAALVLIALGTMRRKRLRSRSS